MQPRAWVTLAGLALVVTALHGVLLMSAPAFGAANGAPVAVSHASVAPHAPGFKQPRAWILQPEHGNATPTADTQEPSPVATAVQDHASPEPIDHTPAPSPEASASEPHIADRESLDIYLDRRLVTEGPSPNTPVVIDYPADAPTAQSYTGRLRLFIDQHGVVRKVQGLPPHLPPPMLQAATSAFLATRFSPGTLNGADVRTKIEVEVSFDPGQHRCLDDCE